MEVRSLNNGPFLYFGRDRPKFAGLMQRFVARSVVQLKYHNFFKPYVHKNQWFNKAFWSADSRQ